MSGKRKSTATGFSLSAENEERIRALAAEVLKNSFAALLEERVLPRPRFRPWIAIGRDYFGDSIRGSGGRALSEALQSSLPDRFDTKSIDSIDLPWGYDSTLLEASVAAVTRAGEPYEVSSPSVQATIDAFIGKLQAVPRLTVLRVVTDVDVEHPPLEPGYSDQFGEMIEIANVRVIRVGNQPERFIERELPSAGFEVDRSNVVVFPGPASLLVATVQQKASRAALAIEARRRVEHVSTAIRLATGSTTHAVIDVEGDPDQVGSMRPRITPLPSWGFRFLYRPVTISTDEVQGLASLASFISTSSGNASWEPVRIALDRLNRSLDGRVPSFVDQVVDLSIGLEAALSGTDQTDVSLRLRTRAASLLATRDDQPEAIYRDVKYLYDLRSKFIHGSPIAGKTVQRLIEKVSTVAPEKLPGVQVYIALDRWRDLLRRAILVRIALATADKPWTTPRKGALSLDVDEHIVKETERTAWLEHIRKHWTTQGIPGATERTSKARSFSDSSS